MRGLYHVGEMGDGVRHVRCDASDPFGAGRQGGKSANTCAINGGRAELAGHRKWGTKAETHLLTPPVGVSVVGEVLDELVSVKRI